MQQVGNEWGKVFVRTLAAGLLFGTILAVYISVTVFVQMSHQLWLTIHNSLVVGSLIPPALIGFKNRSSRFSFGFTALSCVAYFLVFMLLYLGSYTVVTGLFADQMVWIPFFYHDYSYHGFDSVAAYLDHKNNFIDLLELQIFTFVIFSGAYFVSAGLGFGVRTFIEAVKSHPGPDRAMG